MKFETGIAKFLVKQDRAIDSVLKKNAEMIRTESVKVTPLDDGDLRDSAVISKEKGTKYKREYDVNFNIDYAVYVHEDLSVSHPIHEGGRDCRGGAKYLENTMMNFGKLVLKDMQDKLGSN